MLNPNAVRGCRPGKTVSLDEQEITGLCIASREIFLSQPILLRLKAPVKICGEALHMTHTHPYYTHTKHTKHMLSARAHTHTKHTKHTKHTLSTH